MSNSKQNKHLEANRTFASSVAVICIVLVIISAVARLFGILWFAADYSLVPEVGITTQIAIRTCIKLVELTLIYKILCKSKTITCIVLAGLETFVAGFLTGITQNIFNLMCIVVLPVFFNMGDWKHNILCIIDNSILYLLLTLYSATFLFGRVGAIFDVKFNYVVLILCAIDYFAFIIAIYALVELYGGIKLWKTKHKLFKRDSLTK